MIKFELGFKTIAQKMNIAVLGQSPKLKKPKRKLFLITGVDSSRSLAENTKKLYDIVSSIIPDVLLCTVCDKKYDILVKRDQEIYQLKPKSWPVSFLSINQLMICLYILKCHRLNKIETVFFAFGNDLDFFPVLLCKLLKLQIIIRSDGRSSFFSLLTPKMINKLKSCMYKLIEETNYRLADILLTESTYMIDYYDFRKYPRILVNNLYVDLEKFYCKKPLSIRQYTLGFIGRFHDEKGFKEFIHALELIKNINEYKIIIIGEGELKEFLNEFLMKSINSKNIDIISWIPNEKLPEYLNDIQILVLPSKREGLPNIILEAMACGTIILASKVGGIPSVITDGNNGFLLERNDKKCIANMVKRIKFKSNLEQVSNNAQKKIIDEYSFQTAHENFYKAIQKLYL